MNGGFIGGDWYRPETAPESLLGERDIITWGYVIIDKYHTEPVQQTMHRSLCTTFTICYGTRKSDKGYITCKIWGDEDAAHVATTLDKGDWVFMAGKLKKTKFIARKGADEGKEKTVTFLEPAIIIPMPLVESMIALAFSKQITDIIQGEAEAEVPDDIESADDYAEIMKDNPFDYELSI